MPKSLPHCHSDVACYPGAAGLLPLLRRCRFPVAAPGPGSVSLVPSENLSSTLPEFFLENGIARLLRLGLLERSLPYLPAALGPGCIPPAE